MTVTLDIPEDLSAALCARMGNLNRAAMEALAAQAYAAACFSVEQVRRLLMLESKWDAIEVLSKHSVWPGASADEILADARVAEEFLQQQGR
ncbi:UPF0175 family protein [Prosthecobacter sp.]|uniref:UPF0175 family protein n=1 Tax=Prosthecobacter sp. TaxID=1965333 RepID=UPI0037844CB3